MKKRRIVLASVLKPVDDTRMYEKIGHSLSGTQEYEVVIIGYPSTSSKQNPVIKQISLRPFKRVSLERLLTPFRINRIIQNLKPDILIINTPELLPMAWWQRIIHKRVIVYDVLENYYRNIRCTTAYPAVIRPFLASLVRLIERASRLVVNFYILAEKGYESEMPFMKPNSIAENKLPKAIAEKYIRQTQRGYHKLIFTGTIAPTTGSLNAISLCKQLHALDENFTLTLVGHCAKNEFLLKVQNEIRGCPYIKLIGGNALVPHEIILQEIREADIGIIIYPFNLSTECSIPTKLYEYLALHIPMLIKHNEPSHELVRDHQAGIILPDSPDLTWLLNELKNLPKQPIKTNLFWETEGEKIVKKLNNI